MQEDLYLLCVSYLCRRFDPSISSIYERIKNGEIDQIKNIRTIIRDKDLHPKEYFQTSGMFHNFITVIFATIEVYVIGT